MQIEIKSKGKKGRRLALSQAEVGIESSRGVGKCRNSLHGVGVGWGCLLCKSFECSQLWRAIDLYGRATVGATRGRVGATGVVRGWVFGLELGCGCDTCDRLVEGVASVGGGVGVEWKMENGELKMGAGSAPSMARLGMVEDRKKYFPL
jgi:hypothetical protein